MKGEAARVWRYCVLARALNSQTNRCPPHCPGPPSHAPITPTTPMRSPLPSLPWSPLSCAHHPHHPHALSPPLPSCRRRHHLPRPATDKEEAGAGQAVLTLHAAQAVGAGGADPPPALSCSAAPRRTHSTPPPPPSHPPQNTRVTCCLLAGRPEREPPPTPPCPCSHCPPCPPPVRALPTPCKLTRGGEGTLLRAGGRQLAA